MENKKSHVSLSNIFLIIASIVIIIMGYSIYTLLNSNLEANKEIGELKTQLQNMQTTLTTIQNYLNNLNTQKSEKEQVAEIANNFVNAVNQKDWDLVEKYSNSNIANELKKYNVSNMSVRLNTLEKNPNNSNGYYCYNSYDIDYNGLSIKDISLGQILCIDKINGTFVVSQFGATGY